MGTNLVQFISDIIVLSSLVPLALFIYSYAAHSAWTANRLGISLMTQKASMFALMGFIVISVLLPNFPERDWIRGVFYILLVGTFWNDVIQLWRIQSETRRARKKSTRK